MTSKKDLEIEALASQLHQAYCLSRALHYRWDGPYTNRSYWRRKARKLLASEPSLPPNI